MSQGEDDDLLVFFFFSPVPTPTLISTKPLIAKPSITQV